MIRFHKLLLKVELYISVAFDQDGGHLALGIFIESTFYCQHPDTARIVLGFLNYENCSSILVL